MGAVALPEVRQLSVDAAVAYAKLGLPVFPAVADPIPEGRDAKQPLFQKAIGAAHPYWTRTSYLWGATTDVNAIRRHWPADAGVAIAPDHVVIDGDVPKASACPLSLTERQAIAQHRLHQLIERFPELADAPLAETPSGGWHLHIRWPEDQPRPGAGAWPASHDAKAENVDERPWGEFRGSGKGYVLAAPSTIEGEAYVWRRPVTGALPTASPELVEFLTKPRDGNASTIGGGADEHRIPDPAKTAERVLTRALKHLSAVRENRNVETNKTAYLLGRWVGGYLSAGLHHLTEDEARRVLIEANKANGDWTDGPNAESKCRDTISRGLRDGMAAPFVVKVVTPDATRPPPISDEDLAALDGEASHSTTDTRLVDAPTDWPDPKPLPPAADEPGPIDPELLPEALRPWLRDAAERASLPLEYFVPAALVALSGLVGNRVRVQPKRYDDFLIVPNLWGALVAESGTMKSHAINAALAPIKPLERELTAEYEAKRRQQAGQREDLELQEASIQERRKQAARSKSGVDRDSIAALRSELDDVRRDLTELDLPEPALVVNDSTVEKLIELLHDNPRGLTMMRDELLGWLRGLEKQGRESDRTFYLEAWNGDQSYKQHRIGRGTITASIVTLALYGAIQPGAFRKYQHEAMDAGEGADGLLQRFQVLVWPNQNMGPYRHVDRAPNVEAQRRVLDLCRRLYHLDLSTLSDQDEPAAFVGFGGAIEGVEFATLRFDDEAQPLHDLWRTELENRIRSPRARTHRAYLSQISKYRSLFPSLAGLFHLIETASDESGRHNRQKLERAAASAEPRDIPNDHPTDVAAKSRSRISLATARRAAALVDYLDAHARKVYAAEVHADRAAASRILERIKQGHIRDGDTVRDLVRKDWSGLDRAQLELGFDCLEALGWLRVERVPTAGRPSYVVRLHPRIHEHLGGRA